MRKAEWRGRRGWRAGRVAVREAAASDSLLMEGGEGEGAVKKAMVVVCCGWRFSLIGFFLVFSGLSGGWKGLRRRS